MVRSKLKVLFLNVNGLIGKTNWLLKYRKENNIDLMCLVETWLSPPDSCPFKRNVVVDQRNKRNIGRRSTGGILILTSTRLRSHVEVTELEPGNNFCIIKLFKRITMVVGYFAPRPEVNGIFMECLEKTAWHCQNEDTILVGDLNANLADPNSNRKRDDARGRFLRDWLSQNDEDLTRMRPILGKHSYIAVNGQGNPDHLICSNNMIRNINNFSILEKESACGSDHRPLIFTLPFWDNTMPEKMSHSRWAVEKLREDSRREEYVKNLLNEEILFKQVLDPGEAQNIIDQNSKSIIHWLERSMRSACGYIGKSTFINQEFWTDELEALQIDLETYTEEANKLKGMARRRAWKMVTATAKSLRSKSEQRRKDVFHQRADLMANPAHHTTFLKVVSCQKKRQGRKTCQLDTDRMDEYTQYFQTTFAGQPTGNKSLYKGATLNSTTKEVTLDPIAPFHPDDVQRTVKGLKNGKSSGPDGIYAEMLKLGCDKVILHVTQLFNQILRFQKIPSTWKEALICPVFKKGDPKEIENYRPIALTCLLRRLFEKCLAPRFNEAQYLLSDFQGGFRANRSTLDHLFLLEKLYSEKQNLINAFLDLKAAYDMVDRNILWSILDSNFNIPLNEIKLLRELFDYNHCSLVFNNKQSNPIPNRRGLLQGSSLSPTLFNFYINSLSKRLKEGPTINWSLGRSNHFLFADDTALHATSKKQMQDLLDICDDWSKDFGMLFSPQKCNIITKKKVKISLYKKDLPQPKEAIYLGMTINHKGIDFLNSIRRRIKNGQRILGLLKDIGFNVNGWRPTNNITAFKSFIRPTVEYGLQLKTLPNQELQLLQSFQNQCLRTMLSVGNSTSISALHVVTQLETMTTRNIEMNARYLGRVWNNNETSNLTFNWLKHKGEEYIRINNPLGRSLHLTNPNTTTLKSVIPLTKNEIKQIRMDDLKSFQQEGSKIGKAIDLPDKFKLGNLLSNRTLPRNKFRSLILWRLGRIALHQKCKKCGKEVSRTHALDCTQTTEQLNRTYGLLNDEPRTVMDIRINHLDLLSTPPEDDKWIELADMIIKIQEQCLGHEPAGIG